MGRHAPFVTWTATLPFQASNTSPQPDPCTAVRGDHNKPLALQPLQGLARGISAGIEARRYVADLQPRSGGDAALEDLIPQQLLQPPVTRLALGRTTTGGNDRVLVNQIELCCHQVLSLASALAHE